MQKINKQKKRIKTQKIKYKRLYINITKEKNTKAKKHKRQIKNTRNENKKIQRLIKDQKKRIHRR